MTKLKRQKIFDITNGRCFYCGDPLDFETFHADHFVAKSKGGKDKNNLVPTCQDCNLSKGNLSIDEFRKKIEQLPSGSNQCRILSKYYNVKPKRIVFYFETMKGDSNG